MAYQIDVDDEWSRITFSAYRSKVGSKGQILIFNYKVKFKDFYTKLCECYYTDISHIQRNIYSVAWVMSQRREGAKI